MRLLVFIPPKSPPCLSGCFHVSPSGLHFLPKSRCGTWPFCSWCTSEWCESSDSSRRCWPATGDGERLEEFLSGIRLKFQVGLIMCLLNELGMGGEYSRNMQFLKLLGVQLTCENSLIWHHGFVEDSWTFRRNSVKWEEQDGGWKGKGPKMPINGLRSSINSSFPRARMISNTWVEPISGDVPPGWATLTRFEPWIAHEKKASWHRLFLLELGTSWVASMICHEYPWKVACCMHCKSTVLVRFLQLPAIVDSPSKVCWCLTTLATRSTRERSRWFQGYSMVVSTEHLMVFNEPGRSAWILWDFQDFQSVVKRFTPSLQCVLEWFPLWKVGVWGQEVQWVQS